VDLEPVPHGRSGRRLSLNISQFVAYTIVDIERIMVISRLERKFKIERNSFSS
jgi:hypothetical protein